MSTDKLSIYNIALRFVGERHLAKLNEEREPRRLLDEVWSAGQGAINYFLEQGFWNFAIRTSQIDSSSSVDPAFGYQSAFDVPSDLVRLVQISSGEYFEDPLTQYEIETNYIYADVDPIYIRYVSDHENYGNDLSLWPSTFTLWAGSWMGFEIAPSLKNDIDMEKLEVRLNKRLVDARAKDAMQDPPRWPPLSSWARSRYGRSTGRRDRGSRNQLIG